MRFTVGIAAYRPDTLATPIKSILRQSFTDWELIVVGQGNKASGRARGVRKIAQSAAKQDPRVRYVHIKQTGHSRALNAIMEHAQHEHVAVLDDDCEAAPDWLWKYADYFNKWPDVGLVGGATHSPPKRKGRIGVCPSLIPAEAVYDPVAAPHEPPPGWDWISCNMVLRRSVALHVGPFDEYLGPGTVFPAGGETDYKLRMEAAGIKMGATPHANLVHTHGYRYGLKAMLNHSWNYAYGNGALAAKLTMMGDPRGEEWLRNTQDERRSKWIWPFRLFRLPMDWKRLRDYHTAYRHCLSEYRVEKDLLKPATE